MITSLQGKAARVRAGQSAPARILEVLQQGDTLKLEPGATVAVTWYADGHRETASGPASLQVAATRLEGPGVQRSRGSPALATLQPRSTPGSGQAAVTTRGGEESLVTVLPLYRVLPSQLSFRVQLDWQVDSLRVQVLDASNKVVLERRRVKHDPNKPLQLTGSDARGLQEGQMYTLQVFDEDSGQLLASRLFQVVDGETDRKMAQALASAQPGDLASLVETALVADELGLTDMALAYVHLAIQRAPSPELLRWAAALYLQNFQKTEAQTCYRLAEELERGR
jgi:hypothetical protein